MFCLKQQGPKFGSLSSQYIPIINEVEETAHRNDAINVCWLPYYLDKYSAA